MKNILFVFTLIIIGLPLYAESDAEKCIRDQWNEAIKLPEAQNILENFKADENVFFKTLPQRDMFILCRHLGLVSEDLKTHWPSIINPITIINTDEIDKRTIDTFYKFGTDALTEIKRDYDIQLTYTVRVILGYSKETLWESWKIALPNAHLKAAFDYEYDAVCSGSYGGGFAIYDTFVMCPLIKNANYNPEVKIDDNSLAFNTEFIFYHEFFHILQAELLGNSWFCEVSRKKCSENAPPWFREGSAEFFAEGLSEFDYSSSLSTRLSFSKTPSTELIKLENERSYKTHPYDVYELGAAAIIKLMMSNERSSLVNVFLLLGEGYSWNEAFNESFDQSLDVFYSEFNDK